MKVELLLAWPRHHEQRWVDVPEGATLGDALARAGWNTRQDVAGHAIHGRRATLDTQLVEGDRVELLRALELDPKEARRRRAASAAQARADGPGPRSP